MKTYKKYDVHGIEKCHWSELVDVFGLVANGDLDVDAEILSEFLWKNARSECSTSIVEVLRFFLTKLATMTNAYEDKIYLAIATCEDDFTVIKWFTQNIRTFYC